MKRFLGLVIAMPLLTSCGFFKNPAVLDPLVAACAQDLSQWGVIVDAAKTMDLTPMQLATAVCDIPVVVASYAQKSPTAKADAQKAYLSLKVGDIASVKSPIAETSATPAASAAPAASGASK
jgi:hypothetical protein